MAPQIPSSVSSTLIASAVHGPSSQDVRVGTISVNADAARPVLKTKKKRLVIIGVELLSIQCHERNYIRLGRSLEEDLRAFVGSGLQDFYDGYGEKVSYVIVVGPPIVCLCYLAWLIVLTLLAPGRASLLETNALPSEQEQ